GRHSNAATGMASVRTRGSAVSVRSGAMEPTSMPRMVAPFERSLLPQARSARSLVLSRIAELWMETETQHDCDAEVRCGQTAHRCTGSIRSYLVLPASSRVFASSRWQLEL